MADIERIDPEQAREDTNSGALLVCAYDDEAKCREFDLEGAIPLADLQSREDSLEKDRELIFYCN